MRDILVLCTLLIVAGLAAIGASLILPVPDGVVFAYSLLLSAIVLAALLAIELSSGRINAVGDLMRRLDARRPDALTLAAYALGCSLVATGTVLGWCALTQPCFIQNQPLQCQQT